MRVLRIARVARFAFAAMFFSACGGEPAGSVAVVRILAPEWSLTAAPGAIAARLVESDAERSVSIEAAGGPRQVAGFREWSLREKPDGARLGRLAVGPDAAALLHHLASRDRDLAFALEPSRLVRLATRDGERLGLWFEGDRPESFRAAASLETPEAARLVALAQALGAWQVVADDRYPIANDGSARLPPFVWKSLADWSALRQRSLEFFLPPAVGRQIATREGFRSVRDRALAQYAERLPLLAERAERFIDSLPEAERSDGIGSLAPRLRELAAALAGYLDSAWVEFVIQVVSPDSARVRILVHSVVDVRIDAVHADIPGKVLVTESAALAGLRLVPVAGGGPVRTHLGKDRVEFRLGLPVAPHAPGVESFESVILEFSLTGLDALAGNRWPFLAALRLASTNTVTGAELSDKHVRRSLSFADPRFAIGAEPSIARFLADLPDVLVRSEAAAPAVLALDRATRTLTLPAGDYRLTRDFVPPSGYGLAIDAGVSLAVEPGRSLLIRGPLRVRGTARQPVRVRGAKLAQPWGVLAVQGRGRSEVAPTRPRSEIRHLELSGGSQDQLKGVFYSGQLSVHHQDLSLQHVTLGRAFGDDALNVKYGDVDIRDCVFSDNQSDAVDLDWSNGTVTRSFFGRGGRGGDGLDLSGSNVSVTDSVFSSYPDKCLSVGEASSLRLRGSLLRDCTIAIASKDDSVVDVEGSLFLRNERNFAAFVKKPIFGGATIRGRELLLVAAEKPDERDASSTITLEDVSVLEPAGAAGLELDALGETLRFSSERFRSIDDSLR